MKTKIYIIIFLIIFISISFLIYTNINNNVLKEIENKQVIQKEEIIVEKEEILLITGKYIACKSIQTSNISYCDKYEDIEKSSRCKGYVMIKKILENKGSIFDCQKIYNELDEEYIGWLGFYCFMLNSKSRDDCNQVNQFSILQIEDTEKATACNYFYNFIEDENFISTQDYKDLDNDKKNALIWWKATNSQDSNLCEEIISDESYNIKRCKIFAKDTLALNENFCDFLLI